MCEVLPKAVVLLNRLDATKASGELYIPCPRCHGTRYVSAITRCGHGFTPTQYGSFPCETCAMTGEADIDLAIEWAIEQVERSEGESGWFDGYQFIEDRAKTMLNRPDSPR